MPAICSSLCWRAANEYREYIEKDAALERRFQPVMVNEPTVEDTISILRGLKDRYEAYHGVKIMDAALVSAAVLSNRYISDRFLPDKAIDLVDEACALIKTEMNSMPTELDELRRKIQQLEIEEISLKKEDDTLSAQRLADLQKELAELKDKFNAQQAQWQNEKNKVDNLSKLREEKDAVKSQIEQAMQQGNYEKVSDSRRLKRSCAKRRRIFATMIFRLFMRRLPKRRSRALCPNGPGFLSRS